MLNYFCCLRTTFCSYIFKDGDWIIFSAYFNPFNVSNQREFLFESILPISEDMYVRYVQEQFRKRIKSSDNSYFIYTSNVIRNLTKFVLIFSTPSPPTHEKG